MVLAQYLLLQFCGCFIFIMCAVDVIIKKTFKARFTRQFFWHGTCLNLAPVPKNFRPGTLHFCRENGKIRGTSAPKHTGAETTYPHDLGTHPFWGTRATNFPHLHDKNEGCRAANFKRVPCQKSCRVNRALVSLFASFVVKTANLLISRCSHAENCTCSSIFHHTAAAQPHVHQFFFT